MTRVEAELEQQVVGREQELSRLASFLDGSGPPRALVIEGGSGAGKTTVWEAAIRQARLRGLRVLSARPSGAEAGLSFAVLTDLLVDVDLARLERVPAPQRHALDVAMLRAEPDATRPGARAIATGLVNVLRELAGSLVVAVDDVQWLDRPSAEALAFAARRLDDARVRFLLARRSGPVSSVEAALGDGCERLRPAPLSLGATRALLLLRLGSSVPRRVLRQLHESAGGNPLFRARAGTDARRARHARDRRGHAGSGHGRGAGRRPDREPAARAAPPAARTRPEPGPRRRPARGARGRGHVRADGRRRSSARRGRSRPALAPAPRRGCRDALARPRAPRPAPRALGACHDRRPTGAAPRARHRAPRRGARGHHRGRCRGRGRARRARGGGRVGGACAAAHASGRALPQRAGARARGPPRDRGRAAADDGSPRLRAGEHPARRRARPRVAPALRGVERQQSGRVHALSRSRTRRGSARPGASGPCRREDVERGRRCRADRGRRAGGARGARGCEAGRTRRRAARPVRARLAARPARPSGRRCLRALGCRRAVAGLPGRGGDRVAGQRLVWRGSIEQAQALFAGMLGLADERGEPGSEAWGASTSARSRSESGASRPLRSCSTSGSARPRDSSS